MVVAVPRVLPDGSASEPAHVSRVLQQCRVTWRGSGALFLLCFGLRFNLVPRVSVLLFDWASFASQARRRRFV